MSEKNIKNTESNMQEESKKSSKKLYLFGGIALAAVIIAVLTIFVIIPSVKYSNAEEMLTENQFDDAKLIFEELGSFKDSKTMVNETQYQKAQYTLENKMFDEAQTMFAELGEYSDSKTMIDECTYQKAVNMISNSEFDTAKEMFAELGEYSDSADMILECDYQYAVNLIDIGEYEAATEAFAELGDYSNSADMILEADYVKAAECMEKQDYKTAVACYEMLAESEYKDSAELLKDAYYSRGELLYENKKFIIAYEMFSNVPDYKQSDEMLDEITFLLYELGVDEYLNNSDIDKAEKYLEQIPEYEDASVYLMLILLEHCNDPETAEEMSEIYNGNELYAELVVLVDDFTQTEDILMGKTWIGYFLEGEWSDGINTFTVAESQNSIDNLQDELIREYEMGGSILKTTYKIEYFRANMIIVNFGNDYGKSIAVWIEDYDQILVYNYSTDKIYRMNREG